MFRRLSRASRLLEIKWDIKKLRIRKEQIQNRIIKLQEEEIKLENLHLKDLERDNK